VREVDLLPAGEPLGGLPAVAAVADVDLGLRGRTAPAEEERWLRIGTSLRGALLVVWSTERAEERRPIIRIIGARRANRKERELDES